MSTGTRTCQSCGKECPSDQDFCSCGEYLHWEPEGYTPATASLDPAPAPPPPPPPERLITPVQGIPVPLPSLTAPSDAAVVLRMADESPRWSGEWLHATVRPGSTATVLALIRNQSQLIDSYELALTDLPDDWWTIVPDTVYLVPFGVAGTYEQEVEVRLHPPRSLQVAPQGWNLEVVAHSQARREPAGSAPLTLEIEPYADVTTEVRPRRARARRRAAFRVIVANEGTGPARVALATDDPDGELRFEFDRPAHEVPPGRQLVTRMWVSVDRPLWLGAVEEHAFDLTTFTGDDGPPPPSVSCAVRQRPWLSNSELGVIGVLALLGVLLVLLL